MKQMENIINPAKIVLIDVDQLKTLISEAFQAQGKTYNLKETARLLNLSVPTVRKLCYEGRLRATTVGKRKLFSERAINDFHQSQQQEL